MSAAPEVSVVIATKNRPERLARQLASLRAQTVAPERFEVVVVDDGSGPETVELLAREAARAEGPALRVLRHEASKGPAAARNAGWRAGAAPLVAFTDDDCEVTPGWVAAFLAAAAEHPGCFLQGKVLPLEDELDSFGPFSYTLRIEELSRGFETANILYPRELLERLNGFDEIFTDAAGEDTDLGWRAIEDGVEPQWVPDALAYHAVLDLGPMGQLRRAARASDCILAYKRHPGLRRTLLMRLFWSREHWIALRALVALVLPRRLWLLRLWLSAPYVVRLVDRRSGPLLAPYIILRDAVEIGAVLSASARLKTLVI